MLIIECEVHNMKIGEAQKVYSAQLNRLWNRKTELLKQQKENEKNQNHEANEGVILELSNVEKQYEKARKFMDDFMTYKMALHNSEVTKQQGEAIEDAGQEMAKCLEIARRISKGEKVPPQDEKKLLEFDFKLYMSAKNMAIMNKSDKEHDSLWKDEEEKVAEPPISETVDNRECAMEMPEELL